MGKGWAEASPRSAADRHFMLEPMHSLPPVRVCTPPARGEGAMLRGNYTSSSSEVSLDRTPLYHAAAPGPGYPATAAQQLMHLHSAPAEDPGHLRPADSDAQQAQVPHLALIHIDVLMHTSCLHDGSHPDCSICHWSCLVMPPKL